MRVLIVNVVCGIKSTGRICTDLAERLEQEGHEVRIAYGREAVPEQYAKYAVKIGSNFDQIVHGLQTRLFDKHGFASRKVTQNFLDWADKYNPDLLWLHNIHGYFMNVEMLFEWIKKRDCMEVKWTLHDCWSFTGHCTHFMVEKCEQWKQHCEKCIQKKHYPASFFLDNCRENYTRKQKAFTGVKNMKLIAPSKWLAGLIKESFLAEYPVEVCYNQIDTNVFKPTPSDFRIKNGLEKKKIILGVASTWNERKGLYDFFELACLLDDSYAIVLVGLDERQQKNIRKCSFERKSPKKSFVDEGIVRTSKGVAVPYGVENIYHEIVRDRTKEETVPTIICIPRTNNTKELAEIYTSADYFVNPTYEDNYPTVNLEAIACGTYVVTYLTGGSPETLFV